MDQAHLQDTIEKLESLRKKQNAEIDELIVSLQTKATIGTERARTTTKPLIPALEVNDVLQICKSSIQESIGAIVALYPRSTSEPTSLLLY